MTGSTLLDLLLLIYALVLPGVAVVHAVLKTRDPLTLGAAGATLGVFGLPFLDFAVAMMLRTHISAGLILSVSTAVLVAAVGAIAWQRRRPTENAA